MHQCTFKLILTLVSVVGFLTYPEGAIASPNGQVPPPPISPNLKDSFQENFVIPVEGNDPRNKNSIELRYLSGVFEKTKNKTTVGQISFEKTWNLEPDTKVAADLGITIGNILSVEIFARTYCCFGTDYKELSPFFDLGISGYVDPRDYLPNVLDYQRVFATARMGVDNLGEKVLRYLGPLGAAASLSYGYRGYNYTLALRYRF